MRRMSGTRSRATAQVGTRSWTRSRLIRGSTSDGHVRCTASDDRCIPARPALQVWNASVDVPRPDAPKRVYDKRRAPDISRRTSCRVSRGSASWSASLPSQLAYRVKSQTRPLTFPLSHQKSRTGPCAVISRYRLEAYATLLAVPPEW